MFCVHKNAFQTAARVLFTSHNVVLNQQEIGYAFCLITYRGNCFELNLLAIVLVEVFTGPFVNWIRYDNDVIY